MGRKVEIFHGKIAYTVPLILLTLVSTGVYILVFFNPEWAVRIDRLTGATALTLIGTVMTLVEFRRMYKHRLLSDTPASTVRAAAAGFVEVGGRVVPVHTVRSPLAGLKCVYCAWTIDRYTSDVDSGYRWDTIDGDEIVMPFFVKDATGRIHMQPIGAKFDISASVTWHHPKKYSTHYDAVRGIFLLWKEGRSPRVDPAKIGVRRERSALDEGSPEPGDLRYREFLLEPGDHVYVAGTVVPAKSAPGGREIRRGDSERTFIISRFNEKFMKETLKDYTLFLGLGIFMMIVGTLGLVATVANLL